MYECRYHERLKGNNEGSTRLRYTWFHGGLEHVKIDEVKDEKFVS
jgi:hypothetical protein